MPKFGEYATQADFDAHLADTTDAHDASAISIVDSGAYFTGTDVEAALQELGAAGGGGGGNTQVAYAEITSNVQTSGGAETTVVTAPSFTADGTSHYQIDFYSPLFANFSTDTTAALQVRLNPSGANTEIARIAQLGTANMQVPIAASIRVTPASGATVYRVTLKRAAGSQEPLVGAGAGGADTLAPAYIRITKLV